MYKLMPVEYELGNVLEIKLSLCLYTSTREDKALDHLYDSLDTFTHESIDQELLAVKKLVYLRINESIRH